MREIKFRAWDGEDMIFFDLFLVHAESARWYVETIQDKPVMQYTGLKDKNGVEIYEGDVVKTLVHYEYFGDPPVWEVHQVKYDSERAFCPLPVCELNGGPDGSTTWGEYEVIGNIHETPELLESGE